jgi:hypothetical protein
VGVAARAEKAIGDALHGVRRANDGMPDGLPKPRSPPGGFGNPAPATSVTRQFGPRGKQHRFVFALPRRAGPIRSRGAER